ncbi:MAG: alpha/beta hydrolase family protein [Flavobacteriia bacterium]
MEKSYKKNEKYIGALGRNSAFDLEIPNSFNGNLIVFAHGYMGYKDWGAWNLMQKFFAEKGFGFCKFNFSHNGGTVENPIDFPDLEAFANDTYSKEVFDLQQVLNKLEEEFHALPNIHLLGHSRGGGIVLLNANDSRVKSVITLAAISSIEKRFSDEKILADWKEKGIRFVTNQRTKQEMPHSYLQVEDFLANKEKLSIEKACRELSKPILIIHGNQDVSVPISEGEDISEWTNTKLTIIENTDHVFGASQPWISDKIPEKLEEVCEKVFEFLSKEFSN